MVRLRGPVKLAPAQKDLPSAHSTMARAPSSLVDRPEGVGQRRDEGMVEVVVRRSLDLDGGDVVVVDRDAEIWERSKRAHLVNPPVL